MNLDLKKALYNYLMDPKNPLYNFTLGKVYEDMGHTSAAASFYIRTGEFSSEFDGNDLLSYEALLRLALCFEHQGSRVFTTKGILLRAISLMPERPEGYFLLARMYETCKEWQEGYTFAIMGENLKDTEPKEKLITNVEYPGKYGLTFERAITGWWIGLWDESMNIFRKFRDNPNIQWNYSAIAKNNLLNLEGQTLWRASLTYNDSNYEHLKIKFPGAENIEKNYSQCYQDMFVLTMLNGKTNGKYLEIGCADPFVTNNTVLLEKSFGWTGFSIDFEQSEINKYADVRNTKAICADARKINYQELLKDEKDFDYLQVDCDPAIATYNVLLKIPFETHKFAVITFEHDHYFEEKSDVRKKSRKYLESHGYELVAADIAPDNYCSHEDWWVHPDLVDKNIIEKMKNISSKPKRGDKYMLGRI